PSFPSALTLIFFCNSTITLLPPLPKCTVPPYNDVDTLFLGCLDMIPSTGVPNDFCNARVVPFPHLPSTVRLAFAFVLGGFCGFGLLVDVFVEPVSDFLNSLIFSPGQLVDCPLNSR